MDKETGLQIATLGGLGKMKPAPGTWGSAAAVVIGLGLYHMGHVWLLVAGFVVAAVFGLAAIAAATKGDADPDRQDIIIDEVAGQLLALCFPAFGFYMAGLPASSFPYPGWVAAFVCFRIFDIWKPWIIGQADRRGDAIGVMLDDLYAGLFAGIATIALAALSHGVFM